MTRKLYRSAMGKMVDMGTLFLQNENVRAVGNMGVNARGDRLDSANKVIDQKNAQVQRQVKKTATNVKAMIPTSTKDLKKNKELKQDQEILEKVATPAELEIPVEPIATPAPVEETPVATPRGGLAAAIARSREVKQEKEKTLRELRQSQPGVKKI